MLSRRVCRELVKYTQPREFVIPMSSLLAVTALALTLNLLVMVAVLLAFGYGIGFGFKIGSNAVWRTFYRHQLEQIDSIRDAVEEEPPDSPRRAEWERTRAGVVEELERLGVRGS